LLALLVIQTNQPATQANAPLAIHNITLEELFTRSPTTATRR